MRPKVSHLGSLDSAAGAYSARAFHLDSTVDHVMDDFLDTRSFCGVGFVEHDARVEIPVTDVSEDTSEKAQAGDLLG